MSSSIVSACLIATGLFYIDEPVVTMREQPKADSRVASQAIFSEKVEAGASQDGWVSIKTSDGYSGWVPSRSFIELKESYETSLKVSRLSAHVYGIKDTEFGPILTLPYGSRLKALDTTGPRWIQIALPNGKACYIQKGDVAPEPKLGTKADLVAFSQKFLGLPYAWGGRSSFGYDCSGFVQMLYSQLNIFLQRDACQQILDNRFKTVELCNAQPGDLIFFGQSEQKITHVGMYLGNNAFIHATVRENQPWIHISDSTGADWNGGNTSSPPYHTIRQLIS